MTGIFTLWEEWGIENNGSDGEFMLAQTTVEGNHHVAPWLS
jgi:hypothetical protein